MLVAHHDASRCSLLTKLSVVLTMSHSVSYTQHTGRDAGTAVLRISFNFANIHAIARG